MSLYQDSQNLNFSFWQGLGVPEILPFDPNAAGEYEIGLSVFDSSTKTLVAQVTSFVEVAPVPLPAGLPLLALGLGGLVFVRRKKSKS